MGGWSLDKWIEPGREGGAWEGGWSLDKRVEPGREPHHTTCIDLSQIKGTSGLLSKLTFTGEDAEFLLKRQQALEVVVVSWMATFYEQLPDPRFLSCATDQCSTTELRPASQQPAFTVHCQCK